MKNKIIQVSKAKDLIAKNKIIIEKYFEKKYPVICSESIHRLEREIDSGLQTLLCSSIKFKTSRIVLERPHRDWENKVVLTREKCLHYLRRSYGMKLFEEREQSNKIDKDWNLIKLRKGYQLEKGQVNVLFSKLKDHDLIDQEKLKTVITTIRKATKIQKNLNFRLAKYYHMDSKEIVLAKNFTMEFYSSGFRFNFPDTDNVGYNDHKHSNIHDYNSPLLLILAKNLSSVENVMNRFEALKIQETKKYKKTIKELGDVNRPFLVLKSLSKK